MPHCTRRIAGPASLFAIAKNKFLEEENKFLEEARVLAQFRHPGIVQVYGCFEERVVQTQGGSR